MARRTAAVRTSVFSHVSLPSFDARNVDWIRRTVFLSHITPPIPRPPLVLRITHRWPLAGLASPSFTRHALLLSAIRLFPVVSWLSHAGERVGFATSPPLRTASGPWRLLHSESPRGD